jgi:hypothetical protein
MSPIVAATEHQNYNLELASQVFDVGEAIYNEYVSPLTKNTKSVE